MRRRIKTLTITAGMALLLLACLQLGTIQNSYADADIDSGVYDGVPWKITSEYELVIGTDGQTTYYSENVYRDKDSWPWYAYREMIKSARFEGTVIGRGSLDDMFYECNSMETIDLENLDTSDVLNMMFMFYGCGELETLDLRGFNTSNVQGMVFMFANCNSLQNLSISNFDTHNVTDMAFMFDGCGNLKALDLDGFNTSNVTDMFAMFRGCSSLAELDLAGFDTSNVTTMQEMFMHCFELDAINISSFNTENVNNMNGMFYGCSNLKTIDVSSFNTKKVEDMDSMFGDCSALESLDISGFDTTRAYNRDHAAGMFNWCDSLHALGLSDKIRFTLEEDNPWMTWMVWKQYQTPEGDEVNDSSLISLQDYDGQNPGWYRPVITSVSQPSSAVYTGGLHKPAVSVWSGDFELERGTAYTVTYTNNRNAGTAKAIITGAKRFTGASFTKTFKITPCKLKAANVTVKSKASFTGKAVSQKATVKVGKKVLKKGVDYTVSYLNNNKVGTAKVIVQGRGNYSAKITKTFRILPPKITVKAKSSKYRGGKTKVVITLKNKPKCKVSCYEVQIAKNKKFTKGLIVVTPKIKGKSLLMNGKLKKGKKYYVRTRAVTTIKGKDYAGYWSNTVSIKGK